MSSLTLKNCFLILGDGGSDLDPSLKHEQLRVNIDLAFDDDLENTLESNLDSDSKGKQFTADFNLVHSDDDENTLESDLDLTSKGKQSGDLVSDGDLENTIKSDLDLDFTKVPENQEHVESNEFDDIGEDLRLLVTKQLKQSNWGQMQSRYVMNIRIMYSVCQKKPTINA